MQNSRPTASIAIHRTQNDKKKVVSIFYLAGRLIVDVFALILISAIIVHNFLHYF